MKVAAVTESICPDMKASSPWVLYASALAKQGIEISFYEADDEEPWKQPWDAMIFQPWHDWNNLRFKPEKIMKAFERYAVYRAVFPSVVQIACNHSDMSRRPFIAPYWRAGDPILYRTPPYDRSELHPFPEKDIYPFEVAYCKTYGNSCFRAEEVLYDAGLICSPSGPPNYRKAVAAEVAKVGFGHCPDFGQGILPKEHHKIMGQCRIIVCPQGWGGQSQRHWDAWKSGKPILTDMECSKVEMIPGTVLRAGEHYLVYDDPKDIPDIVSDWCRPSRADDLARIAVNGKTAAEAFDPIDSISKFFTSVSSYCRR